MFPAGKSFNEQSKSCVYSSTSPKSSTWVVIFQKGVWPLVLPHCLSTGKKLDLSSLNVGKHQPRRHRPRKGSSCREGTDVVGKGWAGEDGMLKGVSCHSEEVSEQEKTGREPTRSGGRRSWMSLDSSVQKGECKEGQPDSPFEGLDGASSQD